MKRPVLWISCAVLVTGLAVGCATRFHTGETAPTCVRDAFAQCESALWESFEKSDRVQLDERLRLYLSRRGDGWSRLYQEFLALRSAPRPVPMLPLPPPASLSSEQMFLLLAEGAGLEHVVLLREGGTRWHVHGKDPLRPFLLGLPAVLIDSGSSAELEEDMALEREVRRAFIAASAGHYDETAAAVDRLRVSVMRQHASATILRALYALRLFSSAGLALSSPEPATGASGPGQLRELVGTRSKPTTPYAEMLRVLLSPELSKEWALRRDAIEPALLPARRAALLRHFGGHEGCRAEAPTILSIGDLFFASTLTSALAPPGTLPGRGELAFSEWLPRYRTLAQLAATSGSGWYFAPILAQHRGLMHGVNAEEDATFQAVTAMMQKHIESLRGLQATAPQRFDGAGAATWLLWDELRADSALLIATTSLLDQTLRGKLEAGSDTTEIWNGLFTGFFTTLGLSGSMQQVAIQAVHQALTERLRGDLRERSGWSVAGLYALDEVFRQLFGLPSEMVFDGDQILRSLREKDVASPELARLAQAATLYLTLGVSGALDASLLGEPDSFGSARKEAYDALRLAVAGLASNAPPPAEVTAEVALFVDGVLSLVPLALKPELVRSRFLQQGGSDDAVCPPPPTPPTKQMQRALGRLAAMRQRLLGRAWYRDGSQTGWEPRLRALLLLLSDGLDLARPDASGVKFTIPTSSAHTQVLQALQGISSAPFAHLGGVAADFYQLVRRYAGRRADTPGLLSDISPDELRALLGLWQGALGGGGGATSESLIALLGRLPLDRLRTARDLPTLCGELSAELFDKGQIEAGEGLLLAGLFAAYSVRQPVSDVLVEVGARHHSRLLPLLKLYQTGFVPQADKPLNPGAFRDGLRALAAESCQEVGADQTMAILQALGDYAAGARGQARAALRRSLEAAEHDGLSVPALTYQYAEQVGTRRIQLKLDLNFSGSLAQAGNVGQLSVGVSSLAGATRELRLDFQPEAGAESDERALRLYVHAAALYTVYSLVDGDQAAGRFGGARLLSAMGHLLRLGKRGGGDPNQGVSWDARAAVAVAAQLLAEAGQPLLASELWRDAQAALEHAIKKGDGDDDPFRTGAPEMLGLATVPGISKIVERTRISLRRLEPACWLPAHPHIKAATVLSCADYGVEISLRRALKEELDAVLDAEEAARCPSLAMFQPATQHALARELKDLGQPMEAAEAALYRIKTSPYVALKVASDLRRSPELPPWLRASMLEGQILFDTKMHGQPEPDDLRALLADSAQVPGLAQHGRVLRQLVDYAAAKNGLGPLAEAALAPDFVSRWLVPPLAGGPAEEATTALLLQQAAALEIGRTVDRTMTQGAVNVLCGSPGALSDKTLRGALCIEIHKLHPTPGSLPAAQSRAREVYRFLSSKTADFQR